MSLTGTAATRSCQGRREERDRIVVERSECTPNPNPLEQSDLEVLTQGEAYPRAVRSHVGVAPGGTAQAKAV
jgi:hypothetical protein